MAKKKIIKKGELKLVIIHYDDGSCRIDFKSKELNPIEILGLCEAAMEKTRSKVHDGIIEKNTD